MAGDAVTYYDESDIADEILTADEQRSYEEFYEKQSKKITDPGIFQKNLCEYKQALIATRDGTTITSKALTIPSRVPVTHGETAPFNNYLARCNLFTFVQSGKREELRNHPLNAPEGTSVLYTGEELDQYDLDVYLTAIKIAAGSLPGTGVRISVADFMRSMGNKTKRYSSKDRDVLYRSFERMAKGSISLKITSAKNPDFCIKGTTHLLGFFINTETNEYIYEIPQTSLILFTGNLYSYIDLHKRSALKRRSNLAKRLQVFISSHKETYTASLGNLQSWIGYKAPPAVFKSRAQKALAELIEVGELKSAKFEKRGPKLESGMFIWTRNFDNRKNNNRLTPSIKRP